MLIQYTLSYTVFDNQIMLDDLLFTINFSWIEEKIRVPKNKINYEIGKPSCYGVWLHHIDVLIYSINNHY